MLKSLLTMALIAGGLAMSAESQTAERTCIGRFSADVGGGFMLAGADQEFDYVSIEELAIADRQALAAEWEKRLATIRAMRAPRGKDQVVIREENLAPKVKGVLYYGNRLVAREVTLGALVDAGASAAWLSLFSFQEKEPLMKEIVLEVANAYRPSHAATGPEWFCLARGALVLPYRTMEKLYRRFEDKGRGYKLEVDMESTMKPERAALSQRLAGVQRAAASENAQIDRLRGGARSVAGMQGEEVIARLKDKRRSELSFAWLFPGEADSGVKPKILVRMSAPDGDPAAPTRVWDGILNSFKRHGE